MGRQIVLSRYSSHFPEKKLGWSSVLVTAPGSWGKPTPRGHLSPAEKFKYHHSPKPESYSLCLELAGGLRSEAIRHA
jgi:hypothetical protein